VAIENELSFKVLDQFAEAVIFNRLSSDDVPRHTPKLLGPQLELRQLRRQQDVMRAVNSKWLADGDCNSLLKSLDGQQPEWSSHFGRKIGFMRAGHAASNIGEWTGFAQRAKRAATASGLPADLAGQIVSALDELLSNVIEHSKLPSSGFVAFAEGGNCFEIVVADEGIGVLKSLQSNDDYAGLLDDGEALKQFIKDGVSRMKEAGRGKGFRPLFKGLANAHCSIRFRSGDHALEIDGRQLAEAPAVLLQTVPMKGLLCSVACHFPESRN